jgi:hypothetical protein
MHIAPTVEGSCILLAKDDQDMAPAKTDHSFLDKKNRKSNLHY